MTEALAPKAAVPAADLRNAWERLKAAEPALRAREAAARLNVSEAELVASRVGRGVVELAPDWAGILAALPSLGEVMALTRNDFAVHEKVGRFANVEVQPGHALVVNREIDLRIFLGHWRFGFAVEEAVRSGLRRSLQFFDADGTAVHKVYLRERSDADAYAALVDAYAHEVHGRAERRGGLPVLPLAPALSELPDAEIDVERLRTQWASLQDTHDFLAMLLALQVGRVQALRLAGENYAYCVKAGSFQRLLEHVAANAVPIMCFVGNAGCIQIHTGPVRKLRPVERWYNVLDPGFNLHVDTHGIDAVWVVRKPTRDGDVTSLEVYHRGQGCILRLFGERKPGQAELPEWAAALASLDRREPRPREPRPCGRAPSEARKMKRVRRPGC